MADHSTCLSPLCGITVEGSAKKCPKCGWAMRGARNLRVRGWVLLFLGLFILLLMGTITWKLSPMLLHPEQAYADGRYTGTPEQAQMFLSLFLMVILFGALGTAIAIYMIATGRQNKWFVIGTLALAAALYFFARWIIAGAK